VLLGGRGVHVGEPWLWRHSGAQGSTETSKLAAGSVPVEFSMLQSWLLHYGMGHGGTLSFSARVHVCDPPTHYMYLC
jgi:hypothetical protein